MTVTFTTDETTAPMRGRSLRGMTPYERVLARSIRVGECLIFTGSTNPGGYGDVYRGDGGTRKAHRIVLEHHEGPSHLLALHSCDTPACVQYSHLRYGTAADNNRDCVSRGRQVAHKGEANGNSKLTDLQVAAIRADERSGRAIAKDYGVAQPTIARVKRGATWSQ